MTKADIANELNALWDTLSEVTSRLSELVAYIEADVSATAHDLGPYHTATPEGYETVLGYMASYLPTELELLENPVQDTVRDGFRLTRLCKERGYIVQQVEAPEVCQKAGVEYVNAYPLSALIKHFGSC